MTLDRDSDFVDAGGPGPVTTLALPPVTCTAGDALKVVVTWDTTGSPAPTVSDDVNPGNFTAVTPAQIDSNLQAMQVFHRENCLAGATTITVNFGIATFFPGLARIRVWVIAGGTVQLDAIDNLNVQDTPTTVTDAVESLVASTGSAAGLLVSFSYHDNSGGPPNTGTGFTSFGTGWSLGLGNGARAESLAVTAGTQKALFTAVANNQHFTSIALYSEAGAAPSPGEFSEPPLPRKLVRRPVDGWEPVPTLQAAVLVAAAFSDQLLQRRRRAPTPENWEPLPTLTPVTLTAAVFSEGAPRRRTRTAQPENWQPLAPLVGQSAGWGFSGGESAPRERARVDDWEPLASLPTAALTPCCEAASPILRARRAPVVDGWEPLPSLPRASCVEQSSPLPSRRARSLVADWDPLPALLIAPVPSVEIAPPVIPARARLRVENWEPIGPLLGSTVDVASPLAPPRARVRVDGWEPLPALPSPPASVSVDVASPVAPPRARVRVDGWEPLPALPSPPASVSVDVASPVAPPRARVRVDSWEPLPDLPAPVALGPAVEPQPAPPPRARRVPLEALPPLPALPAATLGPAVETAAPLPPRRQRAPEANYEPLAAIGTPSIPNLPPLPLRKARVRVDGWEPLPALSTAAVFSEPPVIPRRRPPVVQGFAPLGPVVLPPSLPSGFECGSPLPIRSHRAQVPDNWTPLADLIPPIPQTNQPYLLAAMA